MDTVYKLMGEHDEVCLYVIFGLQVILVFLGFPWLIMQCAQTHRRVHLSYGKWSMKWAMLCFVGKWMLDVYDLVEKQQKKNEQAAVLSAKAREFDPYKLLHIDNDGSFGTAEIEAAYDRLSVKYHPDVVKLSGKVPYVKAKKRWDNLVKAYHTLNNKRMYNNWLTFGDPDGCMTMQALQASIPNWLLEDDMKPMLITWGFIGGLCILLGTITW